ncbi:ABC transporter permease subunit [Fictibacillus sp. Mic-4]|uniref:ABC transporter permease subunit n=1 Tax=Fictibacillus sp. Mic-4 TaxID=3132826 RepID=UPI003CFA49AD
MKILLKMIIQWILTVVSIILISGLPALIMQKDFRLYVQKVKEVALWLYRAGDMTYFYKGREMPLFPEVLSPYFYSLTILIISLLSAYVMAQLLTWVTLLLPTFLRKLIKNVLTFFESLPDLLVFALMQIFIVYFYKKTHILLSNVAAMGEQRIYIVPIVCLMILPTIYFYKMMVLLAEEESQKPYFEFGRAKGLKDVYVYLFHVTRNTHENLFHFSKTVLWFMISNLLLVEWIFNMNGITHYMYDDFRPEILAICLILIAVPFFVLYALLEWLLSRKMKEEVAL